MTPPCKNCAARTIGCHGKCDRYAAYKQEREQICKARYDENYESTAVLRAMKLHKWQKNKIHREDQY